MATMPPVTTVPARDARAEARAVTGPAYDPRVLEPSPPAVTGDPWWADDPVDPSSDGAAAPVVSPVDGLGDLPWSAWADDHPDMGDWCRDRWLGPYHRLGRAPDGYERTRDALHRLAVYVLSPARQAATGGKMALRWTMGGFGTPFYGDDEQVRLAGVRLIRQRAGAAIASPVSSLAAAADLVLDGPPRSAWAEGFDVPALGDVDARLDVDAAAALWLGAWFGFAWSVLEQLRADEASTETSRVQLWAEHFDAAFECVPGVGRAGYGLSPGDSALREPYAYVTLWHPDEVGPSPLFDASSFSGAALPLSAFVDADDQRATVLAFFRARRDVLAAAGS